MAGLKLRQGVFLISALLIAGTVMIVGFSPVFAGFEWRGASPSSSPPSLPVQMPAQKVPAVEAAPMGLVSSNENERPAIDVVSGFGSDLPLVMALQQVIPSDYPFSLEDGVAPDTRVSWKGDRPWQQVLAEMLSPQGLGFRLQNKTVTIGRFEGGKKDVAPIPLTQAEMKEQAPNTEAPKTDLSKEKAFKSGMHKKADMIPIDMVTAVKEERAIPVDSVPAETPAQSSAPMPETAAASTSAGEARAPLVDAVWIAARGRTLREVLSDWAKMDGIELYWSIDYDYRLNSSSSFNGTFEEAIASLLDQFSTARPQPYGQLYLGENGPRVLVINSYDLPH